MKRILLACAMLCGICGFALAQTPEWSQTSFRQERYPAREWYVGYAFGQLRPNDNVERELEALKRTAQNNLTQHIIVTVQSTSDLETTSRQTRTSAGETEESAREFRQVVETATSATVTNMEVRTSHNRETGTIYALAVVCKTNLANYYQSQISLWLNEAEGTLNRANQLAERGRKKQALNECKNVNVDELFARVLFAQDLLTAVFTATGKPAREQVLQQNRSQRLRNALIQTIADLENSIYIFVEIVETVDGENVDFITNRLPGLLTEKDCNCNFTEFEDQADFVIRINARLTRCNNAQNETIFCYVNATVSVLNAYTQRTLRPSISEAKGGWTRNNRERAIDEAFRELTKEIAEKILPMIKN